MKTQCLVMIKLNLQVEKASLTYFCDFLKIVTFLTLAAKMTLKMRSKVKFDN